MNCFNGERYLFQAINSIINQTYKNWELIFWDNCSTDNSSIILKSFKDFRIKYFKSRKKTNLGAARRNAFQLCTGDFIAFLDVDDIWMPKKLESQLPLLKQKNVGICISNTLFFTSKKSKQFYNLPPKTGFITKNLLNKYFISLETVIINRKEFIKNKINFDSNLSHISDFDIILKISQFCKIAYCNKILSGWRIHESNESFKKYINFYKEKKYWLLKNKNIFSRYKNEFSCLLFINQACLNALSNHKGYSINKILKSYKNIPKKNLRTLLFLFGYIFPKPLKKWLLIKNYILKKLWI